jgi:hypothetical protein
MCLFSFWIIIIIIIIFDPQKASCKFEVYIIDKEKKETVITFAFLHCINEF